MHRRPFTAILALTCAVSFGCNQSTDATALASQVTALADEYLAGLMAYRPEFGTSAGLPMANHAGVVDNSITGLTKWYVQQDGWLARLRAINPAALAGRPEAVTYATLRETLEGAMAARVCREELWGVNSYVNGWLTGYSDLAIAQPVGTDTLRAQALARLRALPRFIDVEVENLRVGLRTGYSSPKVIVRAVVSQLDGVLAAAPAESPFASPALRDTTPAFRAAYLQAITRELQPSLRRYRNFLAVEYLGQARDAIGVSANLNGAACYRALIRRETSLEIAPDTVHRIGLEQMARIDAEITAISARSFGGDSVSGVLERVKTDPTYTFKTSEEIIAYAQAAMDRASAAMPRAFGLGTMAKIVIQPYPEFRAKSGAPGQYNQGPEDGSRPGIFLINASEPARTSRATIESTTFHETYPGHHFQLSVARGRKGVHRIAQYLGNAGYVEGWGLYAERVADELGLYSSDVDRVGYFASQAFRAARLVIDAGIHAKGMSRDAAIAYLKAHSTRSPTEVEGEINRYISMPAQATSYMLGNLEILKLREEARGKLGTKFDQRVFHDRVLEDGVVPLSLLRPKIERWVHGLLGQ